MHTVHRHNDGIFPKIETGEEGEDILSRRLCRISQHLALLVVPAVISFVFVVLGNAVAMESQSMNFTPPNNESRNKFDHAIPNFFI